MEQKRYLDSVMHLQDNVLVPMMVRYYSDWEAPILDCTFGEGRFWKKERPLNLVGIDVLSTADIIANYQYLPFKDTAFKTVIFDPPHFQRNVPLGAPKRISFISMYNLQSFDGNFSRVCSEFYRVLSSDGIVITKMSDEVSRPGAWNHVRLLRDAYDAGLTPFDLVIKTRQLSIRNPT